MDKYVTKQEFDEKITNLMESYELSRKLMNRQAIVLNDKVKLIGDKLEQFMRRKPDPRIIRDAWIQQIPKIRDELQQLQLQFARFSAADQNKVNKEYVMAEVNVSAAEFAAFQEDVNERFDNLTNQITVLDNKIQSVLDTKEVVDFPDEQAQIREKVLTSFQDELAVFIGDLNKLKKDVTTLQTFHPSP